MKVVFIWPLCKLMHCKTKSENKKIARSIIQLLRFFFLFVGCKNGMYGINCKYRCSGHCLNNDTCNFITGFATMAVLLDILGRCATKVRNYWKYWKRTSFKHLSFKYRYHQYVNIFHSKLVMSDILECIVLRAVLLIVFMVYVVIMTEHVLVNLDGVDLLTVT